MFYYIFIYIIVCNIIPTSVVSNNTIISELVDDRHQKPRYGI